MCVCVCCGTYVFYYGMCLCVVMYLFICLYTVQITHNLNVHTCHMHVTNVCAACAKAKIYVA